MHIFVKYGNYHLYSSLDINLYCTTNSAFPDFVGSFVSGISVVVAALILGIKKKRSVEVRNI